MLRIFLGISVNNEGGKLLTFCYLTVAIAGIVFSNIIVGVIDFADVTTKLWSYYCLLISAILAGFGIAIFPMIISVLFWSDKFSSGYNQSIYAGLGNLSPGVFAILMPLIINGWSL